MKRTIPLLITGIVGFILIVSYFVPATEDLGEKVSIHFDILAGIAFILGGGNLLSIHLKKISNRGAGWGYSGVTLIAFCLTLYVGLTKWGSRPAPQLEFYGKSFADLEVQNIPASQTFRVEGQIPSKENGQVLPASVHGQLGQNGNEVVFRGWMQTHQRDDLIKYKKIDTWIAIVNQLYELSQPPASVLRKAEYIRDHSALSFAGSMTDADRDALLAMQGNEQWERAVEKLYNASRVATTSRVPSAPQAFTIPASLKDTLSYDSVKGDLTIIGPLSTEQRDALANQFPLTEKVTPDEQAALRNEIESRGKPLTEDQEKALHATLGMETLPSTKGQQYKALAIALLRQGPLSDEQRDFLMQPYLEENRWKAQVNELFQAAHKPKYRWSGAYRAQGTPFWFLYEYAFKPLTATMFSILAFYVASAAFRAFRAKNVEAILLLGTAFVILLGRTFAGVLLTDWLPDSLAGLKITNLSIYIMQVFNTAGNRAIMIGIALGIASTSLKVLLGIDRSYLGSQRD